MLNDRNLMMIDMKKNIKEIIHFFVIPDFTAKFCLLTSQFLTCISNICGNALSPIVKEDVIKEHLSQLNPKTVKTSLPFKKGN